MSQITKNALAASLKKLLAEKPIEKITIKDITDDCGVNRMTFYYHFKDIYDLLEWICVEEEREAIAGFTSFDSWQEGYLRMFRLVQDHATILSSIYRSIGRSNIERYIHRVVQKWIHDVVTETAAGLSISEENIDFIAEFYKYSFSGIILDWFERGMKEDPRKIVDRLSRGLHGTFEFVLKNMSNSSNSPD